jgi:hypothetical protein
MNKPRLRYSPFHGWFALTHDGYVPYIHCGSGVSTLSAAPSATVGQPNTPDMRAGRHTPGTSVNAVLTSNTKWALQRPACCGEYREYGRISRSLPHENTLSRFLFQR